MRPLERPVVELDQRVFERKTHVPSSNCLTTSSDKGADRAFVHTHSANELCDFIDTRLAGIGVSVQRLFEFFYKLIVG
jgi:hypothetical protein